MECRWERVHSKWLDRAIVVVLGSAMAISPLLVSLSTDASLRFQWRMFAKVNALVTYEIEVAGVWYPTTLHGLSWLDRGRHVGTANLEALCGARPEAQAARRLYWDEVDVQRTC